MRTVVGRGDLVGVLSRWRTRSVAVVAVAATTAGLAVFSPVSPVASAATAGVDLLGHGYGHGRGMGQYGSFGYAVDQGWSSAAILDHYYGGTSAGNVGTPEMSVRLTAFDGAGSIAVTAGVSFWVGNGRGATLVSAGSAAVVTRTNGGWQLTIRDGSCNGPVTRPAAALPAVPEAAPSEGPGSDPWRMVTTCSGGTNYRGMLRWATEGGSPRLVNVLSTEDYLRGVVPRESPAGWADAGGGRGAQALQAQAVAARSYSLSENRYSYAKTCDTQSCQVYGGAANLGRWLEDGRSDAAVAATSGVVRLRGGAVVRTEFSSSTGGWTAGGQFPAVFDAGDSRSPNHTWQVHLDGTAISARYPQIGDFSDLRVVARNGLGDEGGRVTTLDVVGTRGSVRVTGNDFRTAMGLKSDWFTPVGANALLWQARQSASPGAPDLSTVYGGASTTALSCDFNGDGRDDVAVYENGHWQIRFAFAGGSTNLEFDYGFPGATPVCGNWDGIGADGIGVYYQGTWYLRNTASAGNADAGLFDYGNADARPVVGDWDGNGTSTVGVVFGGSFWMLRNGAGAGPADMTFSYGFAGGTAVSGDWNGNSRSGIGIFANGTWYLRDDPTPGPARVFGYGPADSAPVVGSWDAARGDGVAAISKVRF